MQVALTNPRTGEIKYVKVGWSWVLFLFSGFLGIPLFVRGLNALGAIFLALWVLNFFVNIAVDLTEAGAVLFFFAFQLILVGLAIWMGIKGNAYTAKRLLEAGWLFVEPDSDLTKFAKMRWGLHFMPTMSAYPQGYPGAQPGQRIEPIMGGRREQ